MPNSSPVDLNLTKGMHASHPAITRCATSFLISPPWIVTACMRHVSPWYCTPLRTFMYLDTATAMGPSILATLQPALGHNPSLHETCQYLTALLHPHPLLFNPRHVFPHARPRSCTPTQEYGTCLSSQIYYLHPLTRICRHLPYALRCCRRAFAGRSPRGPGCRKPAHQGGLALHRGPSGDSAPAGSECPVWHRLDDGQQHHNVRWVAHRSYDR